MSAADLFVSVVAPLHDDADIVTSFVEETMAMLTAHYQQAELLLIDDGSSDDTTAIVEGLLGQFDGLRIIRLSRHFGTEVAIAAGLDSAIGDFVAVMMPETDPPALVPQMVEQSRRGAGVVFGIRRDRRGESWLLRAGAGFFYGACNRLFKLGIPRNSTHFRVLSRQAVNAVIRIRDRNRYLRSLSAYVGYASQSVIYDLLKRRPRPRSKSVIEGIKLALGILVTNSLQPIYLAVGLGLLVVLANALFLAYVVAIYLFKRHVAEGWTTQSFMLGAMFGALALLCTVVAAYLARLLGENQDRPLYFQFEEQAGRSGAGAERVNIVENPVDR
ncbi:MAG TPA: glycosyltransferase family 2 protein [Gemmatimonadales bacterium]|jgi:glycosyltransferase involved in cell wall biosynthesis